MEMKLLKSTLPLSGLLFAVVCLVGGFRNVFGLILGSGMFGAVPLAFIAMAVTVILSLIVAIICSKILYKIWKV